MFSKNNRQMLLKRTEKRKLSYSIKKLSIGVASVLVGIYIGFGGAESGNAQVVNNSGNLLGSSEVMNESMEKSVILDAATEAPDSNLVSDEDAATEAPDSNLVSDEDAATEAPDSNLVSDEGAATEVPDSSLVSDEGAATEVPDSSLVSDEDVATEVPDSNLVSDEGAATEVPDSSLVSDEGAATEVPDSNLVSDEGAATEVPDSNLASDETVPAEEPVANEASNTTVPTKPSIATRNATETPINIDAIESGKVKTGGQLTNASNIISGWLELAPQSAVGYTPGTGASTKLNGYTVNAQWIDTDGAVSPIYSAVTHNLAELLLMVEEMEFLHLSYLHG
ncbi:YSIRK-type signal peptide-containing protein [Enterococcus gallinarum]|uniref:YSIRK-type signal peptide-containing protein n=2 Tax=Enterococcus gallinarum TaxID=1353 RepID=UPI003D6A1DF2